jgi:hypothetical protein
VNLNKEVQQLDILGKKAWDTPYSLSRLTSELSGDFYVPTEDFLQYSVNNQSFATGLTFSDQNRTLVLQFPTTKVIEFSDPVAGSAEADMIVPITFSCYKEAASEFATVQLS